MSKLIISSGLTGQTKRVKYVYADDKTLTVTSEYITVGDPPELIISDLNSGNSTVIENVTNLGLGIARDNGWVVQIAFVLPGEKVRARIFRNHKSYSDADCIEVLEKSPDRVDPHCSLFGTCGGCQYQSVKYLAEEDKEMFFCGCKNK